MIENEVLVFLLFVALFIIGVFFMWFTLNVRDNRYAFLIKSKMTIGSQLRSYVVRNKESWTLDGVVLHEAEVRGVEQLIRQGDIVIDVSKTRGQTFKAFTYYKLKGVL